MGTVEDRQAKRSKLTADLEVLTENLFDLAIEDLDEETPLGERRWEAIEQTLERALQLLAIGRKLLGGPSED